MALIIPISFKENEINLYYKIKNHILGPSTYLKLLALKDNNHDLNTELLNNNNKEEEEKSNIIYKQKKNLNKDDFIYDWGSE